MPDPNNLLYGAKRSAVVVAINSLIEKIESSDGDLDLIRQAAEAAFGYVKAKEADVGPVEHRIYEAIWAAGPGHQAMEIIDNAYEAAKPWQARGNREQQMANSVGDAEYERRHSQISGAYNFETGWRGLALTPDGDAYRLLETHHDRLLVAEQGGDYPEIYVLDADTGLWSNDPAEFLGLHHEVVSAYAGTIALHGAKEEIKGVGTPTAVAKAVRDCVMRKSLRDAEQCRKSIGSILSQIRRASNPPEWARAVNRCRIEDIDTDVSCIAAPNGVIDLRTAKLLSPMAARRRYLTRENALPQPYDPGAEHPNVARLLAHMEPALAAYFFQQIAYCLLGHPTRRVLFLKGTPDGGKTTLMNAISTSLGPGLVRRPTAKSISRDRRGGRSENDSFAKYYVAPARILIIEEAAKVELDEELIKERSGDVEMITFSEKYKNPVSKPPTGTILFIGNERPKHIGLSDPGMLDRCRVMPFTAVPDDDKDGEYLHTWTDTSPDGVRQRQAFVTFLVRLAAKMKVGAPPAQPESVLRELDDWAREEIGEAGLWLRHNLVEDDGGFVVIEDVWTAWKDAIGADNRGNVHNVSRQRFAAYTRGIVAGLPSAYRNRVYGELKYGWRGWRLLNADDEPFVDYPEMGLDTPC